MSIIENLVGKYATPVGVMTGMRRTGWCLTGAGFDSQAPHQRGLMTYFSFVETGRDIDTGLETFRLYFKGRFYGDVLRGSESVLLISKTGRKRLYPSLRALERALGVVELKMMLNRAARTKVRVVA